MPVVVLLTLLAAPRSFSGERLAVAPIAREDTGEAQEETTDLIEAEVVRLLGAVVVPRVLRGAQIGFEGTVCQDSVIDSVRSAECVTELAQAVSVRYVVTGTVLMDGAATHLALQLFDAQKGHFVTEQQLGTTEAAHVDLQVVARVLTKRLLGPTPLEGSAVVRIEGPARGSASIDDSPERPLPLEVKLSEGAHRVRLLPQFEAASTGTFDVLAGEQLTYTLAPVVKSERHEILHRRSFPWRDLAGIGLGAGLAAACVFGATQINTNVTDHTAADWEGVAASIGFVAGANLLTASVSALGGYLSGN